MRRKGATAEDEDGEGQEDRGHKIEAATPHELRLAVVGGVVEVVLRRAVPPADLVAAVGSRRGARVRGIAAESRACNVTAAEAPVTRLGPQASSAGGNPFLGPPTRMHGAISSLATLLPLVAGSKWPVVAARVAGPVDANAGHVPPCPAAHQTAEVLTNLGVAEERVDQRHVTRVAVDEGVEQAAAADEDVVEEVGAVAIAACRARRAVSSPMLHGHVAGHGVEDNGAPRGASSRWHAAAALAKRAARCEGRRPPQRRVHCSDPVPRGPRSSPPIFETATVTATAHSTTQHLPLVATSLSHTIPDTTVKCEPMETRVWQVQVTVWSVGEGVTMRLGTHGLWISSALSHPTASLARCSGSGGQAVPSRATIAPPPRRRLPMAAIRAIGNGRTYDARTQHWPQQTAGTNAP